MRSTYFFTLAVLAAGCATSKGSSRGGACLADQLGRLETQWRERGGCAAEPDECRRSCENGDVSACMTGSHFKRACELGVAKGCTGYGAELRASGEAACAAELFKKACAADEGEACGLHGRVLIEDLQKYDEGKQALESACARMKGFSCRVLAMHLESGKLGEYPTSRVSELLGQACAGG
ncbi:MAG: hypothetical protein JNK82_02025, partial [Myxococcaceae bacterium]|nr:hypothetical protein [Myxococcaceae bacterium]